MYMYVRKNLIAFERMDRNGAKCELTYDGVEQGLPGVESVRVDPLQAANDQEFSHR
jgi:hypothetical protein